MKKQYIAPSETITTTIIMRQHLLAGSKKVESVSGLDGVTKGDGDFEGGTADSRSKSVWDDDWDF